MVKPVIKEYVKDFKDCKGCWVREKGTTTPTHYLREVTRAGLLWGNINSRCKAPYWRKYPTYIGTENRFSCFESFADWCNAQYGYTNRDRSGRYWSLDKDLRVLGNRVYSEDTCLFAPNWVNTLMLGCSSVRGEFPIGVNLHKSGKYIARCGDYLGLYETPHQAHKAWQERKLDILQDAVRHSDIENHIVLVETLYKQAVKIRSDLDNGIETKL